MGGVNKDELSVEEFGFLFVISIVSVKGGYKMVICNRVGIVGYSIILRICFFFLE